MNTCNKLLILALLGVILTAASLPARGQCFAQGLQFYEQPIGMSSTPQQYVCRFYPYPGLQSPIGISRITVNSDFAETPPKIENLTDDYAFGGTCKPGVQVTADQPCTISIMFTPQSDGPRNAVLTVHYFIRQPDGSLVEQAADVYIWGVGVFSDFSRPTITVVEYYNAALGKYFLTSIPEEMIALDNGLPQGWSRSGATFNGLAYDPFLGTATCRYLVITPSDFTHWYFTASAYRCGWLEYSVYVPMGLQMVEEDPNVFSFVMPSSEGWCPYATVPLYRLWDRNIEHRFTIDPAIRASMVAQGWVSEGYGPDAVIACVSH